MVNSESTSKQSTTFEIDLTSHNKCISLMSSYSNLGVLWSFHLDHFQPLVDRGIQSHNPMKPSGDTSLSVSAVGSVGLSLTSFGAARITDIRLTVSQTTEGDWFVFDERCFTLSKPGRGAIVRREKLNPPSEVLSWVVPVSEGTLFGGTTRHTPNFSAASATTTIFSLVGTTLEF